MKCTDEELSTQVLQRFLRYVRIETTSDRAAGQIPSTSGQWELLKLLAGELRGFGLSDVDLDENGFLIARIPATEAETEGIGFISHVDTSSDVPAGIVNPLVHENYDGSSIGLSRDIVLDPRENPVLRRYAGETIITSDGTTLLGADDKAGVAEMMTFASMMHNGGDFPHGEIELIFTPDEETGHGMDRFPLERINSVACYTLDGSEEGTVEAECFNAVKIDVVCHGISCHTGTARGKLVNAISMMSSFLSLLPKSESPETTDARAGFYAPIDMGGGVERAKGTILIRDFEQEIVERRVAAIHAIAKGVEAAYPGGRIEIFEEKQYSNMRAYLESDPRIVTRLDEAIRMTGVEPSHRLIRGGTDGARLSEMGIPTPNIFTGGHNFHSRSEWAALPAMVRAVRTIENLCLLWATGIPNLNP